MKRVVYLFVSVILTFLLAALPEHVEGRHHHSAKKYNHESYDTYNQEATAAAKTKTESIDTIPPPTHFPSTHFPSTPYHPYLSPLPKKSLDHTCRDLTTCGDCIIDSDCVWCGSGNFCTPGNASHAFTRVQCDELHYDTCKAAYTKSHKGLWITFWVFLSLFILLFIIGAVMMLIRNGYCNRLPWFRSQRHMNNGYLGGNKKGHYAQIPGMDASSEEMGLGTDCDDEDMPLGMGMGIDSGSISQDEDSEGYTIGPDISSAIGRGDQMYDNCTTDSEAVSRNNFVCGDSDDDSCSDYIRYE